MFWSIVDAWRVRRGSELIGMEKVGFDARRNVLKPYRIPSHPTFQVPIFHFLLSNPNLTCTLIIDLK